VAENVNVVALSSLKQKFRACPWPNEAAVPILEMQRSPQTEHTGTVLSKGAHKAVLFGNGIARAISPTVSCLSLPAINRIEHVVETRASWPGSSL